MQRLSLLIAGAVAVASASEVTPVQKVIQLLENMKVKGTEELKKEQEQFKAYSKFCEQTLIDKGREIAEGTDTMEQKSADIESAKSEQERLATEIAEHAADIGQSQADQKKATEVRGTERADFEETHKDYTESVDALGRAIKGLKADAAKHVSLVQLRAVKSLKMLPEEAVNSIDAYLNDAPEATASAPEAQPMDALLMESSSLDQPPKAKTFESSTGGIIEMLEGLQDKFVDERNELEKEETKKKHEYELLMQGLKAQEAQDSKDKQQKTEFQSKQAQRQAGAEADYQDAADEKDEDTKYRDDLKATCTKKASDFEERQKLRKEEIEVVGKAQDIISGGAVAGSADKHLPGFVQTGSALAFLRSDANAPHAVQVAKFLQQQAAKLNSRVLAAAAVRAGADPMEKVKRMIENLIVKLNEEANKDATKEAWCQTELSTNKATREDKSDTTESLQSEVDALTASIQKLGDEGATLTKELSELQAAIKESTEIRTKESEKNLATIKDAKEAQKAVAQALEVLKEFYTRAGEATALVQSQSSSSEPEIFGDEPYKGMGGESGGVVGILEVIESDFARLESETTAAESAGKEEYEQFMLDSKMAKKSKETAKEHKAHKHDTQSQELAQTETDLAGTQKELDAAMTYYEKLKDDCINTGKSYAERKAQQEQEIKDLQEALEML
eukprot:CAMPEP_0197622302 /NCGR_PEP_ID=MMETSP1338-20131121/2662_1 /TAXON_ID=43686 ORGANISM="Pelagodinium beii, Strain RCC1491" /NCGR_SAMPLE_ID=MMETSP1338 /ASSEMBLY_ACC=CAM_ASM_000754 /LENGTH=676 /DNA_ID=CAMNT_0043192019 /DNA_START=50 /DNA_END=2080 /DNA_ORIENTATION=-